MTKVQKYYLIKKLIRLSQKFTVIAGEAKTRNLLIIKARFLGDCGSCFDSAQQQSPKMTDF